MSLPIISYPIYETTLPYSKKKIKFRPFLTKENKILIIALDSKIDSEIVLASKQVLTNCTFNEIDVGELSEVDYEWLLIELRKKSKGEKVDLIYECRNSLQKCNHKTEFEYDLKDIIYNNPNEKKEKDGVIQITDDIGVKLKHLTIEQTYKISSKDVSDIERICQRIYESIEMIYSADEVFYKKDLSEIDIESWIDNLSNEQLLKITEYIENTPTLLLKTKIVCEKCNFEDEVEVSGVLNFLV